MPFVSSEVERRLFALCRVSRPWPVLSACPGRQPKGSARTGRWGILV